MASVTIQCWCSDTQRHTRDLSSHWPYTHRLPSKLSWDPLLSRAFGTQHTKVSELTSICHNLSKSRFWVPDPSSSQPSDLLVFPLSSPSGQPFWLLQDLAARTLTLLTGQCHSCLPVITQNSTHPCMSAGVLFSPVAGMPPKGFCSSWSLTLISGSWASMYTTQRGPHPGK